MSISTIHPYKLPNAGTFLALIAKRTYRIVAGRRLEVADEHEPVRTAMEFADSTNPGAGPRLLHECDLSAAEKPFTDVVVRGSAHSTRGPVRELRASVEVGNVKKTVRVSGDRFVDMHGERIVFTSPDPFERMPLTWDHAYGGRDGYAEQLMSRKKPPPELAFPSLPSPKEARWSVSYPRNIAGRGFYVDVDRRRILGARLPNLDDPADPVVPDRLFTKDPRGWIDLPAAAGFGAIDPFTFPRAHFLLPPEANAPQRPVYEVLKGVVAEADLPKGPRLPADARIYNCAATGLASQRLRGGERVLLENMHPTCASIEFALPAAPPRLILKPPGCPASEVEPLLQTVSIEPDSERITLTWAGKLQTGALFSAEDAREVGRAVLFQ